MSRRRVDVNFILVKKILATIGVFSLVVCVGGSNKNKRFNKRVEEQKIIDNDSKSNQTIEYDLPVTHPTRNWKRELLDQIEQTDFDFLVEDIFKSIVRKSLEEESPVIKEIYNACYNKDKKDDFFSSVIFEMAKEKKEENNYPLKNLKIFNNLDKKQKNLPKQILLMNHYSTYGKYKFYKMIGSKTTPFLAFITDEENHVLFAINFMYSNKEMKVKNIHLQDFSKLLNAYNIKKKEKYTYHELCGNLTFKLSMKMNDHKNNNSKTLKVKDIVVVDINKVFWKDNTNQRYYFLKYHEPYLFASKTDSYIDIFNPNANIIIDQENTLEYQNVKQNIVFFDSTKIGNIESSFQSLHDFLSKKKIFHKESISYEDLSKINKKVNKKDNKVKVKTK